MEKYEQFEHTGDIGIRVFGENIENIFENAAFALFDLITDLNTVRTTDSVKISVSADDREELLVNWLSELNFLFLTEYKIFREFTIHELSDTQLTASAYGQKIDPNQHVIDLEIKAVTFHQLKIEQHANGWIGQIIFDI